MISQGGDSFPHFSTNPNKLTKAEIIFYWQIILLVLYLGLAGTSIILHRLEKEVRSHSRNDERIISNLQSEAGIPWLLFMSLLLLVDLVAFSLTMTDFKYLEMSSEMFSCELNPDWSRTRRYLTIITLALIFSRGVFLWLLNLYLFTSVLRLSVSVVCHTCHMSHMSHTCDM